MKSATLFACVLLHLASSAASADIVLTIDTTNPAAVVVSSTNGVSSATISGVSYGIRLDGPIVAGPQFVGVSTPPTLSSTLGATSFNGFFANANSMQLRKGGGQTLTFASGTRAFTGSISGDASDFTFAPVGTIGNVRVLNDFSQDTGVIIGQYQIVPAPGTAGLLALAGLIGARRRR